jgi:hypothetical protein
VRTATNLTTTRERDTEESFEDFYDQDDRPEYLVGRLLDSDLPSPRQEFLINVSMRNLLLLNNEIFLDNAFPLDRAHAFVSFG